MFFPVFSYIYPCCFQLKPWNSWQNDRIGSTVKFQHLLAITSILILKRRHVDELLDMFKESSGSLKDFRDPGLASKNLPVGCDTGLGTYRKLHWQSLCKTLWHTWLFPSQSDSLEWAPHLVFTALSTDSQPPSVHKLSEFSFIPCWGF